MWNSDNPSSRNYEINTCSQVPKSLDLLWTEVQGWYNPTTFSMTEVHRIRSEPKFKDDTILPPSRWPKFTGSVLNRSPRMIQSCHLLDDRSSPDPFWTEVQGWYNPTTFTGTKIFGYILNQGSGMMQSYHFHEGQDLRIHFELRFRDDAIPPHSRGPRPPDTFWTEVQGWCNPTTFTKTKITRSIIG